MSSSQRRFLVDIAARLDEQLAPVFAGPTQLLHADLHGGNVKWHSGKLAIFDFDDSGAGAPLQDLAISAFYVRDNPALEAAMIEGYTSVRSLPGAGADYEALVANRQLHLINFVIGSVNADMVDFAGPYVKKSIGRLKTYLKTGRFELQ